MQNKAQANVHCDDNADILALLLVNSDSPKFTGIHSNHGLGVSFPLPMLTEFHFIGDIHGLIGECASLLEAGSGSF